MEFKTGDDVVHPNYGVGSIVRLEERELADSGLCWYYVLAIGTATVWMPVHADGSTTLRAVTRGQDLEHYRTVLSGQPTSSCVISGSGISNSLNVSPTVRFR